MNFKYDKEELQKKTPAEQKQVMRQWFFTFFEDPANETPYESREGGYQYIRGGPYNAEEELREAFEAIVGEEPIMALVDELLDLGHEWAPTTAHPNYLV